MVRAVDFGVAIQAGTVQYPGRIRKAGDGLVLALDVAVLAKLRQAHAEQVYVVGTVRGMAGQAVLLNRRVLPEKRSALLGVALEAGVIDGIRAEHSFCLGAVRVMTITALHQGAAQFVPEQVRRALDLSLALVGVAGEAGLILRALRQKFFRCPRMVDAMAGQAAHLRSIVRVALPECPSRLVVMAGQASCRRFHGFGFPWIEDLGWIGRLNVGGDVAVAGSTTLVPRDAELLGFAVPGGEVLLHHRLMTSGALRREIFLASHEFLGL